MARRADTQCRMVLAYLKEHGAMTPMDAIYGFGITRLAARIADLRAKGIDISSEMVTGRDREGRPTRHAVYRLKEEGRA